MQGKSKVTIESYAKAVRRITTYFDKYPDQLSLNNIKDYFTSLISTHSWSTVKIDRNGLMLFYKHVLGKEWIWVDIVKPPQVKSLPDVLASDETKLQEYLAPVVSGLNKSKTTKPTVLSITLARYLLYLQQSSQVDGIPVVKEAA